MSDGNGTGLANREPAEIIEARHEYSSPEVTAASDKFGFLQRQAGLLSKARLMPDHLKGSFGDCFLICEIADRWGLPVMAVASESFVVGNKLSFQGKLVNAVINKLAGLTAPLRFEYANEGSERTCRVIGRFRAENIDRDVTVSLKEGLAHSKGARDKWTSMPDQMLAYYGGRAWARRHSPETLLGIYSEDETPRFVESIAAQSSATSKLNDRLQMTKAAPIASSAVVNPPAALPEPGEIPNEETPDHVEPEQSPPAEVTPPAEDAEQLDPAAKEWGSDFINAASEIAQAKKIDVEFFDGALKKLGLNEPLAKRKTRSGWEFRAGWLGKLASGAKLKADGTFE